MLSSPYTRATPACVEMGYLKHLENEDTKDADMAYPRVDMRWPIVCLVLSLVTLCNFLTHAGSAHFLHQVLQRCGWRMQECYFDCQPAVDVIPVRCCGWNGRWVSNGGFGLGEDCCECEDKGSQRIATGSNRRHRLCFHPSRMYYGCRLNCH